MKRLQGKTFSPRSQISYRREAALQAQLSALQQKIGYSRSVISTEEAEIKRLADSAASGESYPTALIPRHAARLRDAKDNVAALEPVREKIQAQLDTVTKPSPSEIEARAAHQKAVAALALERLELDRTLAKAARGLQSIMEKREELTGRMSQHLARIDFTYGPEGLGQKHLDTLRAALDADIEGASEEWLDVFFGENQSGRVTRERYVVRDAVLYIGETLASAGVLRRGDELDLTAEQLKEVPPAERRVGHLVEEVPGGFRSGERVEVYESRVEKVGEAARSVTVRQVR